MMNLRSPRRGPLTLAIALMLALVANGACAAALGSLATSVGLFAALAALFVIKAWPAHLPASALSTAGAALVVAGGAAWAWRARSAAAGRIAAFAPGGVATPAPAHSPGRMTQTVQCRLPQGLDRDTLLVELRLHFVRLQEAWDLGAMPILESLTTPDMLAELCSGLPCRTGGSVGERSDVVTLQAELFAFEELGGTFLASVEFSGLMRESPADGAAPFRELWMLTRSKHDDSGWKLARHQALV